MSNTTSFGRQRKMPYVNHTFATLPVFQTHIVVIPSTSRWHCFYCNVFVNFQTLQVLFLGGAPLQTVACACSRQQQANNTSMTSTEQLQVPLPMLSCLLMHSSANTIV